MAAAPEHDRRTNKEKRLITHIVEVFNGKQGRKVAFGIWGFIAANTFLANGKLDVPTYWYMFLTCALLIGFGTIVDSIVSKLGDAVVAIFADKVSRLKTVATITEKNVTEVKADAAVVSNP